jgi:hypothetical protein
VFAAIPPKRSLDGAPGQLSVLRRAVDVVDDEDGGVSFGGFEAQAKVFDTVDDSGEVSALDVGGLGVVVGEWEGLKVEVVVACEASLVDRVGR